METLAREIYGGEPWMLEGRTFHALRAVLLNKDLSGINISAERANTIHLCLMSSNNRMIALKDRRSESSDSTKATPLIAVTKINGTITKGGGASSTGMKEISQELLLLDADSDVIGHIILIDSGGGSSSGMEIMNYTLRSLKKPKVGLVERSGMAASAAYGILANTDYAMAEDKYSEVGSIGTLISFAGYPTGTTDNDGAKHITAYATASTAKNKAFEQAINTDSTELLVSEILDPFNERFMASMKDRRPNIKESQLDGSMYNAGDVVGSMVDEIGDFSSAVNKVLELSNLSNNFSTKNKKPNKLAMTVTEIQSQFPEAYAAIHGAGHSAGVSAEQERVKCWQVFAGIDQAAVNKGIESGKAISQSESLSFTLKAASSGKLEAIKSDGAADILVPPASSKEDKKSAEQLADEKEANELYGKYIKQN